MMRTRSILLLAGLLLQSGPAAIAQAHHAHPAARPTAGSEEEALATFVAQARAATRHYHERSAAIAEGFRRLGPDFPGMGEHWVNPGRMVDGTLDVARPQALSYAMIAGEPVLIGVVYARPLRGAEQPPEFPVGRAGWHDHVGSIDEESVLLHHVPTAADTGDRVRLAMLHAWIWLDNPDGVFAADNWALPFVRLGIDLADPPSATSARALSLAAGGDAYYQLLFRALAAPEAAEEAAAAALLAGARAEVEEWIERKGSGPTHRAVSIADLAPLELLWTALWAEIGARLRPEAAGRLHPLLSH